MRALVIGLAQTGVAVTQRLRDEGWDVDVLEDAPASTEAYATRAALVRGSGARLLEKTAPSDAGELARGADLVVPSPLVRPDHVVLQAARDARVAIRSEIDLASERSDAPIVAVTGTNGKTTVTELTASILIASGVNAVAAGNIGRPLLDAVGDDADVFVAEVSSFQLEQSATFHPRVGVLLAITPDHLDWHGGYENYVAAKARITAQQDADDVLVFDADDVDASAVAKASTATTIAVSSDAKRSDAYRVVDGALLAPDGHELARISTLPRALPHDLTNSLSAAAAALAVGASDDGVRAALARYRTLPHRVALVGEARGVRWYDDSKATNPDATLRALSSFDSVVLVAGGRNKGLDLSVLTRESTRLRAVVAIGESAGEVEAAFAGMARVVRAASMHAAVAEAAQLARPGDVVLLSPACASFDWYTSYAARGDDFAAEVDALIGAGSAP
jgi:UDP-N-acetylmuramoylalanine--D-glutamate ligase